MPATDAMEMVTIGVSDIGRALDLFRDVIGLIVEADHPLTPSLAAAWGLDGTTGRVVELSCGGYPVGRLRLLQVDGRARVLVRDLVSDPAPDTAHDIGPMATDFYVRPPIAPAYEAIIAAGWRVRSAPILHHLGDLVSEEFVFWGPDGVPLLMMVGHVHGPESMRALPDDVRFSEVATISVIGGGVPQTRAFYADLLGLETLTDEVTAPEYLELVNELTGTPPGTPLHWLVYGQKGEPSGKILVIHFGGIAAKRLDGRMRPGHLGCSLFTHRVNDVDALASRAEEAGHSLWRSPCEVDAGGGRRRRICLIEGPNAELFEFVQR